MSPKTYGWYNEQGHGLADEFRRSVDACLAVIQRHPEAFPKVHRDLRRALLRRFPLRPLLSAYG